MKSYLLILILLQLAGCRQNNPKQSNNQLLDATSTKVLFQRPDCLPRCTAEDQARLQNSSEIEATYIAAIKNARTSIDFSQFTFSRKPVFDALVDAAQRGVKIRGIMDRAQFKTTINYCQTNGCMLPPPFSEAPFVSAPVNIRLSMIQNEAAFKNGTMTDKLVILLSSLPTGSGVKPAPGKERLVHNKFVLIDNLSLLSGSGNWSSTAGSVNLENLTRFDSTNSAEIPKAFLCMFDVVWSGDPNLIAQKLPACQLPGKVYFSPAGRGSAGPQNAILSSIDSTTSTVDIAMHHLVDPEVIQSLINAKKRGVTVRVAVDDDDCNMKEDSLTKLEGNGIDVRYVPTSCKIFQLSHNKYGVFDKTTVLTGSGNWSKSGLGKNYENFVESKQLAADFHGHFEWVWSQGVAKSQCQCDTSKPECIEKFCLNAR